MEKQELKTVLIDALDNAIKGIDMVLSNKMRLFVNKEAKDNALNRKKAYLEALEEVKQW